MRIVYKKRIIDFYSVLKDSKKPLMIWYRVIEKNKFSTKTYKALLNDLSVLYDDTALLSESLLKMTPRKK